MRDIDIEFLAQAFADVGIDVPLGSTKIPEIRGFIAAIAQLGQERDKACAEAKSARINANRRIARAEFELECSKKDVAKYKEQIADLKAELAELQPKDAG